METVSGFDFPKIINDDVTFIRSKSVATHSRLRVQAICPLCPLVEGDCLGTVHSKSWWTVMYSAVSDLPFCITFLSKCLRYFCTLMLLYSEKYSCLDEFIQTGISDRGRPPAVRLYFLSRTYGVYPTPLSGRRCI